jgi:uncharacterized protein YutE (UPF0331/DUF86 family)
MPVDRFLVERKIALVLDDLEKIRKLAGLGLEVYLSDPVNEVLAERYLERVAGRVIDINFHLCTEVLAVTPRDYGESFVLMARTGIVTAEEARQYAGFAGLRNRLVHEYNGIDERLIYQALSRTLADLPHYLAAIRQYLDRQSLDE